MIQLISRLVSQNGNEQVGDGGRAHVAERGQLLTVELLISHTIEKQDAATERPTLVNRFERPCRVDPLGMYRHFQISGLEVFHAATEYDLTAVDKHEIGKDILDVFHLVSGHHDGATAIEVVGQQRVVKLFAVQEIKAKGRLVQHQQFRVNRHDQREVPLGHHGLR